MTAKHQKEVPDYLAAGGTSLARYLFFVSSMMVFLAVIIIAFFWTWFEISNFNTWSIKTRHSETKAVEEMLIRETHKAKAYVNEMITAADSLMRRDLLMRVREAHAIASHLHLFYKDIIPDNEIQKMIIEALRPIRFNNGNGFYFIIDTMDIYRLYPSHSYAEGRQIRSIQGDLGAHIISSMLSNTREYGETYHHYRWLRRKGDTEYQDKTAALIHFEAFDWVIGTSGYDEDYLKELQTQVLSNLEKMRFGGDGSVFAGQLDGISLGGATKGQNLSELRDVDNIPIIQELIAAAKSGGGFVRYTVPDITLMEPKPKLSYVEAINKWDWYLGAGIYIYQIEELIDARRQELKNRLAKQSVLLILVLMLSLSAATGLGFFYRRRLEGSVSTFTNDYLKAAHSENEHRINPAKYKFREFQQLAETANTTFRQLKELQKTEQESKIRYQAMFENAGDAILIIQNGLFIECNPMALQIFKAFPEEIIGKAPAALSPEHQPDGQSSYLKAGEIIKKALDGKALFFEWMHQRADGSNFLAEVILNYYAVGEEKFLITILRDISERKRVEQELAKYRKHLEERIQQRSHELEVVREELIRQEKMAILGRLTATVAHEIRNPLGTIRTSLFAINDIIKSSDENRLQRASMLAERNIRRIDNIIEELLDYSRKRVLVRKKTNMDTWVNNLLEEFIFSKDIELVTALDSAAECQIDSEYFRRAVINLLQNAQQAMSEATAHGKLLEVVSKADKEKYQLIIRDSGTGISDEIMEKLFTPLFSTKSYGIGLGLAIVKDIILDHQGHINFRNHSHGAEAIISLPLVHESSSQQPKKRNQSE
jgi:PAS domain S-box-containing protein